MKWDPATSALVATVHMTDLAAAPGSAENIRIDFTYEATQYELTAVRDLTGAVSGSWSEPGLGASSLGVLAAAFDNATGTITVTLPAEVYAAAQSSHPALQPGSAISGLSVLSQRLVGTAGAAVTATADSASLATACAYTVPTAGADPIVPEVPYAALLPVVGLGLLGFFVYRRRRATDV